MTKGLGAHGLAAGSRVVYEKPFGTSPAGFRALDQVVHSVLDEDQVYRIDHFLGKEATQNLHVLRFANELIGGIWDRRHVESVQIDVPERLGIRDRAVFYDATGAMLDMLVTHLFQVAAEVAMDPPKSMSADDLQSAREKVIKSFRPLDPAEVVLGQFTGYRDVPGVAARSKTDTYVAAKLWIDNPRWRDVPFLLRTGKELAAGRAAGQPDPAPDRRPVRRGRPAERPHLLPRRQRRDRLLAGGQEARARTSSSRPTTSRIVLNDLPHADALPPYVRLIHDVLLGDRSLFTRPDGLAAAWKVIEPVLAAPPRLATYAPGSWGPTRARALAKPGRWLLGQ